MTRTPRSGLLRHAIVSAIIGFGAATIVAGIATFLDWQLNPGGIFRSEAGTNWQFVIDTFMSWFIPVFIAVALLCAAGLLVFASVARRQGD